MKNENFELPKTYKHYEIGKWVVGQYGNKRLAIRLYDEIGITITTITVNVPEVDLEEGEILIKDWAENRGMAVWLAENGVIDLTGKKVKTGFVYADVVKLTEEAKIVLKL